MSKDTQSGKKGKIPRSPKKPADPVPETSVPPSRARRARQWVRDAGARGTQAAFAELIKRAWLWGGAAVAVLVGAWYFEVDVRPYVKWVHYPPLETGSITKVPAPATDPDAMKREVECRVKRVREIDRLIDRRKLAWGVYDRCKFEWKADQKQTAEEGCAPHLVSYRQLSQEVKDRQARDECSLGAK